MIGVSAVLLGLGALLVIGVTIAVVAALATASRKSSDPHAAELDALGRSMLRKVRDERDALAKVARTMPDSPLAADALMEAESLYHQSARAAEKRVELRKLAREKAKSDFDIAGLQNRIGLAQGPERSSLEQALASKQRESEQYGRAEQAILSIEGMMQQAAASISEVRAQLAVSQGTLDRAQYESDELGGLVTRLRTMSQSFQEAEEYLNQR